MMEFVATHYRSQPWKANTRETVRRQTMHQFCQAGIASYNPDMPDRSVNSPHNVYQLTEEALNMLHQFNSPGWESALAEFKKIHQSLSEKYAAPRKSKAVSLKYAPGKEIFLSPGEHSELIANIVSLFVPHHVGEGVLIYVGDTGDKWGYFDRPAMDALGVQVDHHGKMPDVVIHYTKKDWLILCEAVTSHGPVDSKRHNELKVLFKGSKAGLVFVSAFPSRQIMRKYLAEIAWETEVWCADQPSHLIHFNGERFLGPYTG